MRQRDYILAAATIYRDGCIGDAKAAAVAAEQQDVAANRNHGDPRGLDPKNDSLAGKRLPSDGIKPGLHSSGCSVLANALVQSAVFGRQ